MPYLHRGTEFMYKIHKNARHGNFKSKLIFKIHLKIVGKKEVCYRRLYVKQVEGIHAPPFHRRKNMTFYMIF